MPQYSSWLQPSRTSKFEAYCTLCQKSFNICNMGLPAVTSHAAGMKHLRNEASVRTSGRIQLSNKTSNGKPSTSTYPLSQPATLNQPSTFACSLPQPTTLSQPSTPACPTSQAVTISNLAISRQTSEAEIIWILKMVMSNMSFRSCDNFIQVLQRMLPGTQTLQQMSLSRDKASYSVQFGLAPYFHDRLMDCVL